jgi:hypothetical protein
MKAELRIRIRSRIRMFLGLLDLDPEQLVGKMNGSVRYHISPDPSTMKQKK